MSELDDFFADCKPVGSFQPSVHVCPDSDRVEAHWKPNEANVYSEPVTPQITLHISTDTNEVVGVSLYGVKNLIAVFDARKEPT